MDFDNNLSPAEPKWNQMENALVTYRFNKDRERIVKWICDQLFTVFR